MPQQLSTHWRKPREQQFQQFVDNTLEPFWVEVAEPGEFTNQQGLVIHYVSLVNSNAKQTFVVSPGRVEGYLKYKELAYDLFQQGYSVFIIDHQGQGLSSRKLSNPHKGYVASFEDYVDDLHHFVEQIVRPKCQGEMLLLAHSMGCAIGLRYLQRYPATFDAAVFSSPMWGFLSGGVPKSIAKGVVGAGRWLSETVTGESAYFFGNRDYEKKSFKDNQLTSSEVRYRYFRDVYDSTPELQLGGITFAWIIRAVELLDTAYANLDKISVPVLVLQAGEEGIIDNRAQDQFCAELSRAQGRLTAPKVMLRGKHELFIERDEIRAQVLQEVFQFADMVFSDRNSNK